MSEKAYQFNCKLLYVVYTELLIYDLNRPYATNPLNEKIEQN
jgi:hypothetical protein